MFGKCYLTGCIVRYSIYNDASEELIVCSSLISYKCVGNFRVKFYWCTCSLSVCTDPINDLRLYVQHLSCQKGWF